jgi:hypothetical protein
LDAKAQVDALDNEGASAAHKAAFYGKSKTLYLLYTHGANVKARDLYGTTPLHNAAFSGSYECCSILIQGYVVVHPHYRYWQNNSGALINVRDCEGTTPFMKAGKSDVSATFSC